MAGVKGSVSWVTHFVWMCVVLLATLAVAFFVIYLIQKANIPLASKGATMLANAAKGKEVAG